MGARGKKPAPTVLKLLDGKRSNNPDEPLVPEAATDRANIVPPHDLSAGGQKAWDRIAPQFVQMGVLTAVDVDLFAILCETIAAYWDNWLDVQENGYTARGSAGGVIKAPAWQIMRDCEQMIAQISSRFGLTPADRADIKIDRPGLEATASSSPERLLS